MALMLCMWFVFTVAFQIAAARIPPQVLDLSGLSEAHYTICKSDALEFITSPNGGQRFLLLFNATYQSGWLRGKGPFQFDAIKYEAVPGSVDMSRKRSPHFHYIVRKNGLHCFLFCGVFDPYDNRQPEFLLFHFERAPNNARSIIQSRSPESKINATVRLDYDVNVFSAKACDNFKRNSVAEWWHNGGPVYGDRGITPAVLYGMYYEGNQLSLRGASWD